MRGWLSILTKEKNLQRYRAGVLIASAEADVIAKAAPIALQRFPNTRFTLIAPQAHSSLLPPGQEILWLEDLKARPLRSISALRRRQFDLCVVLWANRPTYRKTKFASLFLNAQRTLFYNENADSILLARGNWETLLKHVFRHWIAGGNRLLFLPLGFPYLCGRVLWLEIHAAWSLSTHELDSTQPGREHGSTSN
jgi:hypothetical protein